MHLFIWLLFPFLIIGGMGSGVLLGYWSDQIRSGRGLRDEWAAHPDAPWQGREDWCRNESLPVPTLGERYLLLGCVLGGLFWAGTLPSFLIDLARSTSLDGFSVFFVTFTLILIGPLWKFLRDRSGARARFLVLKEIPLRLGGRVEGKVLLEGKLLRKGPAQLKVGCYHQDFRMDGESLDLQTLFDRTVESEVVQSQADPKRWEIPVSFSLPEEGAVTNYANATSRTFWTIEVFRQGRGRLHAAFELPVFQMPTGGRS